MNIEIIVQLEATLPAIISRDNIERLTGGLIRRGSIANADSRGEGPRSFKVGRKVAYTKSDFICWLKMRASAA